MCEMCPPQGAKVQLRYESSDATQTRYAYKLEELVVLRVYVEHATQQISISRGTELEPSHVLPVKAMMTDEPDSSSRGDRTGLRVKGTHLTMLLAPAFQIMLVALSSGKSIGGVVSLSELPTVTDEALKKLLEG